MFRLISLIVPRRLTSASSSDVTKRYPQKQPFRQRRTLYGCLALLLLFVAGCGADPGPGPDRDPRTLAAVDGFDVSVSWFEQTYIDFLVRSGSNDSEVARTAHLEQLIDALLLSRHYSTLDRDTTRAFREEVRRIEAEELGSRFFETAFLDTMTAPTDVQLRQAYIRAQSKRVVRHLYFTSSQQVEESYARLQSGVPFLEEAQYVYGLSEPDSMAGFLGPIGFYSVDDAFAEAAFSLEPGAFSEPVRSRYGYHIILLENIIQEPLLTESAYLTRRSGLSSQYRQRRRRLEGDVFVRTFMNQLNVEVNTPAIEALDDLITSMDPTPDDAAGQIDIQMDTGWKQDIDPSTPLLTFDWNGEREAFTAGDYAFWFDALPQREARERTAASVGRALRNEALARAGEEEKLRDDEWETEVDRRVRLERARLMREDLRMENVEIDTSLVRQAFDRLGWANRRMAILSFDAITAVSPDAVQRAAALTKEWPIQIRKATLESIPEWSPYVASVPVDSVVFVGRRNDWAAIRVLDRQRIQPSWEQDQEEIVRRLRPFVAEYELVKQLRERARIEIDRGLMREIATF